MKMHNDLHTWPDWLELIQSWWRGETSVGAVLLAIVMAILRIAYGGGIGFIGVELFRKIILSIINVRIGVQVSERGIQLCPRGG